MSAPEPRLSRQKRRHKGPLIGMAVVVAAVLILFFWMIGREADEVVSPEPAPATEGEALVPPQTDDSQLIAPDDEAPTPDAAPDATAPAEPVPSD